MNQVTDQVARLRASTSARVSAGRKAGGFTQDEAARHLRISTDTYGRKERGEAAFSVDQIRMLEELFCLEEADLYRAEGPLRVHPRQISDGEPR